MDEEIRAPRNTRLRKEPIVHKSTPRHKAEVEAKANLFANQCAMPQERHQARRATDEEVEAYLKESEARVALMLQKGLR